MKHQKIIFLDIDGVLNICFPARDKYGSLFHPHLVENLKLLIQATQAKIVISSSWRDDGLEVMQEMWQERKLPGEVIDITPNFMAQTGSSLQRGNEIQDWLDRNPTEKYVIIDDDYSDINPEQLPFFVRTSDNQEHQDCIDIGYGLTYICTQQAINILNS